MVASKAFVARLWPWPLQPYRILTFWTISDWLFTLNDCTSMGMVYLFFYVMDLHTSICEWMLFARLFIVQNWFRCIKRGSIRMQHGSLRYRISRIVSSEIFLSFSLRTSNIAAVEITQAISQKITFVIVSSRITKHSYLIFESIWIDLN